MRKNKLYYFLWIFLWPFYLSAHFTMKNNYVWFSGLKIHRPYWGENKWDQHVCLKHDRMYRREYESDSEKFYN